MFKAVNNYPYGIKNVKTKKKYIEFLSHRPLTLAEYEFIAEGLEARAPTIFEMRPYQIGLCHWTSYHSESSWDFLKPEEQCDTAYWVTEIDRSPDFTGRPGHSVSSDYCDALQVLAKFERERKSWDEDIFAPASRFGDLSKRLSYLFVKDC